MPPRVVDYSARMRPRMAQSSGQVRAVKHWVLLSRVDRSTVRLLYVVPSLSSAAQLQEQGRTSSSWSRKVSRRGGAVSPEAHVERQVQPFLFCRRCKQDQCSRSDVGGSSHASYFSTQESVEELILFVLALPLLRRGGLLDHVRCERRDPRARVLLRVLLHDVRRLQALDHERVRVVQDLIEDR